jgi:hypothetical protein
MLKDTSQDCGAGIDVIRCDGCGQLRSDVDLAAIGDGALRVCATCYERARMTFTP